MRGQPLRCLAQLRLAKKTIEYKQVCTGCPTVAVRRAARVPSPQAWGSSVRSRIETNLAGPGRNCNLHLPEPLYLQDWVFTVSGGWIPGNAYSFFFVQTKDELACSLDGTRDHLSESRFRAVQCYDDPTNDCGSGSDT